MEQVCKVCGVEIPEERLEFLRAYERELTCVKHSKEQIVRTFMVYQHKTAGDLVVIPNKQDGTNDEELVRQAERAYRRAR